jgi:hypothetical protein
MDKSAVSARTEKLRERTQGWSEATSQAAKTVAELFPSNLTLPMLLTIVNKMVPYLNNDQVKMDGTDTRSKAAVLYFMDRHWDLFQHELPNWFCADRNLQRISPK